MGNSSLYIATRSGFYTPNLYSFDSESSSKSQEIKAFHFQPYLQENWEDVHFLYRSATLSKEGLKILQALAHAAAAQNLYTLDHSSCFW